MPHLKSLEAEWQAGVSVQEKVLRRARRVSALTIPHLIPADGVEPGADLPDPFQSVGARGVNNLASKLMMTLLPTQAAWFTYEISPAQLEQFAGSANAEEVTQAELALAEREKAVLRWVNTRGVRARAFEFLRHLLVAGTSVMRLYRKEKKPPRIYRFPFFQVRMDADGLWDRLLLKEGVRYGGFDPVVAALLQLDPNSDRPCEVYTCVLRLPDDKWVSWQEAKRMELPGSRVEYRDESDVPYIVSRFGAPSEEDYGRSHGEENLGDLRSVEGLTQAVVEAAAIAAETKFAVNPASGMTPLQLQQSANGEYLAGNGDMVKAIRVDKAADLQFAAGVLERAEGRVAESFLLHRRRQGERVTATEIEADIRDLEEALGGGFSVLSLEFQEPLARKVERILMATGELEKLPKGVVDIRVVTGLEALGRGQERLRLRALADDITATLGPDAMAAVVHPDEFIRRSALANGVNPEGLIKTQEEMAAERQAAQEQAALQAAAPQIARSIGDAVNTAQ